MASNPLMTTDSPEIIINKHVIGLNHPTYFVADIAANHNGSLAKAKELISIAKEAGADAVKFQHFQAEKIVSRYGFEAMSGQVSHQSKWKKSVFQVYQEASVPWEWTEALKKHAEGLDIDFFSAPYDFGAIDMLDQYVPAYKIGSGDITWYEALERIARKQKPILLATGASTMEEVEAAVRLVIAINPLLCLMQCNTNYTASRENFKYIQLNVLRTYKEKFPGVVLGLSDHTPGHTTVLGAVSLGARVIEKHFTDDRRQEGPDHAFSMDPKDWREMVAHVRELELALGTGEKKVEENESQTVLIQRRCCRAARDLKKGEILKRSDIDVLRPVQPGAVLPQNVGKLSGKKLTQDVKCGEALQWEFLQ